MSLSILLVHGFSPKFGFLAGFLFSVNLTAIIKRWAGTQRPICRDNELKRTGARSAAFPTSTLHYCTLGNIFLFIFLKQLFVQNGLLY
jgi:hypothetical protein